MTRHEGKSRAGGLAPGLAVRLAWRFGRAKGVEGFISVVNWFSLLGVMIGVASLVVVMAVMDGFQAQIVGKILDLNGHLSVYLPEHRKAQTASIEQGMRGLPSLEALVAYYDVEALVTNQRRSGGALLRGVSAQDLANKRAVIQGMLTPDWSLEGNKAVIGYRLAQRLGVEQGDSFLVLLGQVSAEGLQMQPKRLKVEVGGIFKAGFYRYDTGVAYLPIELLRAAQDAPGSVSSFELTAIDKPHILTLQWEIYSQIANDILIQDWAEANKDFLALVETQKRLLFLILLIIVIVAAFNIVAGQVMLVQEKARNIAILRTMGTNRPTILTAFLLLGGGIGAVGTAAGLGLGLLIARNLEALRRLIEQTFGITLFPQEVYFLAELPAQISPPMLAVIALASLALCLLASLYPAWQAARTAPAEVLRRV